MLNADADRGDVVQSGYGDRRRTAHPRSVAELAPGVIAQHRTVWSMRKAQALDPPVLTATAPVRPTTVTGIELLVFVPSPSSPNRLSPQQLAVPFASSAQLVS